MSGCMEQTRENGYKKQAREGGCKEQASVNGCEKQARVSRCKEQAREGRCKEQVRVSGCKFILFYVHVCMSQKHIRVLSHPPSYSDHLQVDFPSPAPRDTCIPTLSFASWSRAHPGECCRAFTLCPLPLSAMSGGSPSPEWCWFS